MVSIEHKPELIIIAGPNGSGKTSITQKFLHHEWAEGTMYINPDQIAKDVLMNGVVVQNSCVFQKRVVHVLSSFNPSFQLR